jgi:bifunctional non-homologous end joining protein LigD
VAEPARRAGSAGSGGLIRPMLATAGPVPAGPGWAFEVKFDGVRAIGYATPDGLRVFSRNDRDISRTYPDVAGLRLEPGVVLDGELVAWDERGRPDFGLLQQRMHLAKPSAELISAVPVRYVVFDVLRHAGGSLLDTPYGQRRAVLDELGLTDLGVVVPDSFRDVGGELVLAAVARQGLEGVVAKRLTSPYQPGRRSRAWIKTPIRHTAEVIIAGWSPSTTHAYVLSALLLAAHDSEGRLVYVGDVGTGFTDAARRHLKEVLRPLHRDRPPFPAPAGEFVRARGWPGRPPNRGIVQWVAPQLVGEIEYRAFTRDGNFRHPSWRGLRLDRDPAEVHLPTAQP